MSKRNEGTLVGYTSLFKAQYTTDLQLTAKRNEHDESAFGLNIRLLR